MLFWRSTLFNILFYGTTAVTCLLCLPGLFMPKRQAMWVIKFFVHSVHFLEKHILNLDYEVRGADNIPASGSFIVAAKHESPYETMKLCILFDEPAIVLKKELLWIPIWGWFLAKTDPIAINRSKLRRSLNQITEGARRIKEQGRPIVIFPQGTRVLLSQTPKEKPYKIGVARAAEAAGLPVIPLALNTGVFWPRKSWIKKPGKVIFEFLLPVPPNLGVYEIMKDLEMRIEEHSRRLADEALQSQ